MDCMIMIGETSSKKIAVIRCDIVSEACPELAALRLSMNESRNLRPTMKMCR
jgi:hypothetical protein